MQHDKKRKNIKYGFQIWRIDKVVELITLIAKPSGNISVHNQPISE